ncbi:MAG: DUF4382 domain-containing protein [Steroidobacteraceae bacterium]
MRIPHTTIVKPALAVACALLASCGGDDSMTAQSNSTLRLDITDAPLDTASKVWLQFTGVEVKPAGGTSQNFTFPAKGFDLLTLRNGNAANLLGDTIVPSGEYEWVRLILDSTAGSSYIVDATGQHDLRIPSGAETGLKLVRGFTMPAGGRADFTIDFVLNKSIIAPPGQAPNYLMKPVLRMTDNITVGVIAGTFAPMNLAAIPACANKVPKVYLYQGAGVAPDDLYNPLNGSMDSAPTIDPLVTTTAALNASSQYAYRIAFVPAGTYTVAFTCDNDDPAVDEDVAPAIPLQFTVYSQPVVVAAGQTAIVNF